MQSADGGDLKSEGKVRKSTSDLLELLGLVGNWNGEIRAWASVLRELQDWEGSNEA